MEPRIAESLDARAATEALAGLRDVGEVPDHLLPAAQNVTWPMSMQRTACPAR